MLYSLFIYQSSSGLMLWKKTFEKKMDPNKVELFSSFFSAIRSFVKEIIEDSSKEGLKNLEMGNFAVNINHIAKLDIDIVSITDKGDQEILKQFIPKLIKILYNHEQLFHDWDGNRSRFDVLDLEIMVCLTNECEGIFDSVSSGELGEQITGLKEEQKQKYKEELKFLDKKFLKTTNLYKKIDIIESMTNISSKLGNNQKLKWCQRQKRQLEDQIDSTKYKVSHFLSKAKDAVSKTVKNVGGKPLSELNYRDVYISLYSFSSKLKLLGKNDLSEKYRGMAKELIDKNQPKEIPNLISNILQMPDDVNRYLQ